MKKAFLGLATLLLLTTSASFAGDGTKKVTKAKTECSKSCPGKDCQKGEKCPQKTGCVCH